MVVIGLCGIRRDLPVTAWANSFRLMFLVEFGRFLRIRKKYWLLPVLFMMAIFGGLLVLSHGSAIAPFIYTLF